MYQRGTQTEKGIGPFQTTALILNHMTQGGDKTNSQNTKQINF